VNWAIEDKGYSQRRACGLVGIEPRVYRYQPTRPDDAALRQRLRELAAVRRRFGYRWGRRATDAQTNPGELGSKEKPRRSGRGR
jgi:hypothetical protein